MQTSIFLGISRHAREVRTWCAAAAPWPRSRVVVGETGAGKGVVVEELRLHLPPTTPYARVSAAAMRHNLIYSTLFGYTKGAFTGAVADMVGLLAVLDGGILFIDDFQDVSEELQGYLLDIADYKPLWALNAKRGAVVNLRLIIGTQKPLAKLTNVRVDLRERLDGVTLDLLPLRERLEDIPCLADDVLARLHAVLPEAGLVPTIAPEAMALLQLHRWPKNIRELECVLERSVFQCLLEGPTSPIIDVRHLPLAIQKLSGWRRRGRAPLVSDSMIARSFRDFGNVRATAEHYAISARTVRRRLRVLGIALTEFRIVGAV